MSACVENWVSRLKPPTDVMVLRLMSLFMRWLRDNGGIYVTLFPDHAPTSGSEIRI